MSEMSTFSAQLRGRIQALMSALSQRSRALERAEAREASLLLEMKDLTAQAERQRLKLVASEEELEGLRRQAGVYVTRLQVGGVTRGVTFFCKHHESITKPKQKFGRKKPIVFSLLNPKTNSKINPKP
jgi:hypothetical protein